MSSMADPLLKDQLLEDFDHLPPSRQRWAARYVHSLRSAGRGEDPLPPPTPGESLLPLAGTLDDESARQMQQAIEEECERVDLREW